MKPKASSPRVAGMLACAKQELAALVKELHGTDERALEAVGALVANGHMKALTGAHRKGIVGARLVQLYEHCKKDPWRLAVILERKKPFDEVPPEQLGLL